MGQLLYPRDIGDDIAGLRDRVTAAYVTARTSTTPEVPGDGVVDGGGPEPPAATDTETDGGAPDSVFATETDGGTPAAPGATDVDGGTSP